MSDRKQRARGGYETGGPRKTKYRYNDVKKLLDSVGQPWLASVAFPFHQIWCYSVLGVLLHSIPFKRVAACTNKDIFTASTAFSQTVCRKDSGLLCNQIQIGRNAKLFIRTWVQCGPGWRASPPHHTRAQVHSGCIAHSYSLMLWLTDLLSTHTHTQKSKSAFTICCLSACLSALGL